MASSGVLLLVLLLSVYLCHASLSPYGRNVQTRYETYYVREGTSKLTYYYVRVCTRTCGAHLVFCWKKKWVCRDQRRSRWQTVYKQVRKYRPIYYCKYGWKQSGSSCTVPRCYGCYNGGYCNRPWNCVCRSGFYGSRCRSDINECSSSWRNGCSYKPGCRNTHGSYRCTCPPSGYTLSYRTCYDINECSSDAHNCSYKEGCQNTQGSYRCTCETGYQLDDDQRTCKDVDECSTYENDCSYKSGCQNTNGSFLCTCLSGHYLDADMRTCKDINECESVDCQQNCINYPGGYNCSCYNGYRTNRTDYKQCVDIDECSEKLAGCSQICTNTAGGFNCSCNSGFYLGWDKQICIDIDECKSSQPGCQHMCVNTLGSYKCQCRPGFELSVDGKNCIGLPCIPIYRPVNGNKTCSGYTAEHTCLFSCSRTGYKLIGSHNRTCTASKRWSGREAKCKPIHCPVPVDPANGFIYSPCNTRFNSKCRAGCNSGYYINQTAKLTCTLKGTWEPRKITCVDIKVCAPNPCRHGGHCTVISSSLFTCNCSNTGYQGRLCEIGLIDVPDYPKLAAGVPIESVEFRASSPDNYVIFTPRSEGVKFDPPYIVFQRNSTTQSIGITGQYPGLNHVSYSLSGPSAAGFQTPEPSVFFVESAENSAQNNTGYGTVESTFPSGCYNIELNRCPRSDVTVTARSTSPWNIFGRTATTDGLVSLRTDHVELPHSMAGSNFIPEKSSSPNIGCVVKSSTRYFTAEMIRRRVLAKSFLNVVRSSLPKWLDIKLRGNSSSSTMAETDLQAYYLSGKSLRDEAGVTGQPFLEDTFFSLLLSSDIDLVVHGDRVSFGLDDRTARFSVALELCGPPPSNVILRPPPNGFNVMNQLSIMKQLRNNGWNFNIRSSQFSNVGKSTSKSSMTLLTTFSKKLVISSAVESRLDFGGTMIINVTNMDNIMDFPLHQKWLIQIDGNYILTLNFKAQNKMTKLVIEMAKSKNSVTFGGSGHEDCSSETISNPQGLFLTSVRHKNPFARTELDEFIELDQANSMRCFLSTIFSNNGSNYRVLSNGFMITFRGHLKLGALRFENLNIELWMENQRCLNTNTGRRSEIVVQLRGNYQKDKKLKKLGIFHIPTNSVVNLNIGEKSRTATGGSFLGHVNILGFKSRVNVNISHDGLRFHTKGKVYDLFDALVKFKSPLMSWNDQRFTATGVFESKTADGSLHRVLENELTRYSTEILATIQNRLELSTETQERAKSRLEEVQILRDEWLTKFQEIKKEYGEAQYQLKSAEYKLGILLELANDYSDEIQQLRQELNKLCMVKSCPKICQRGRSCSTCWEDVVARKMGKCPATCHNTKQERTKPFIMDAICKNEYCKRIHAVHSPFGDILGLVIGIGGTMIGVPPSISFAVGKSVSQFTRSIKKGKPDFGALLGGVSGVLNAVGASEEIIGLTKIAGGIAKGDPSSILREAVDLVPVEDLVPEEIHDIYQDAKNIKNDILAPFNKVESLLEEEIISPFKDTVGSLVEEELVSPLKDKAGSLVKEKLISPLKDKARSLVKEKLISPLKDKAGSLVKEKLISPLKDKAGSLVKEKLISPLKDKAGSLVKEKITSPLKDKVGSLAKEKLTSPFKDKAGSLVKEEIIPPGKRKIRSLQPLGRIISPFKDKAGSLAKEKFISPLKGNVRLSPIESIIVEDVSSLEQTFKSSVSSIASGAAKKIVSHVSPLEEKFKSSVSSIASGAAKKIVSQAVPIVGGILSLVDKSQGTWDCKVKEEKCTKERFDYKYIHTPYTCELPCEQRYVSKSIQKSCCSIVPCASFVADVTCISEKAFCKKARIDALEQISKVKAHVSKILGSLDGAQQNVSYWEMKKERLLIKVRSASRFLQAYQNATRSLEGAYNVTVQNRKRKLEILAKPLMLKNLFNELGESQVKVKDIKFNTKVSPEHDLTLLPINITVTLNGTVTEKVSTIIDFTNFNRSLRSIAKDILSVYVGDVSRLSRKKRSIENTNASNDDPKFYTLQTFHRLCSEFSNHKQTLYEIAASLYNLSSEIHKLRENETPKQTSSIVNSSAIFERVHINKTKGMELGIDINYVSYSNALENDPELLEAMGLEDEALKENFEAVESSSKLLYKNWLATMDNIFETISDECSGFDDCLKYTIDSLAEIIFDASLTNAERLRAQIENIEAKFFNLTRQSDMSVSDALHISHDILRILENMTGVEDVCAQAPNITEHPSPFTELGVNDTLVLRCNATGNSLVYQWRFNGEILRNQSTNILRINNTSPLHSGNYSCDVSNHVAKATSILALVVVSKRPLIVNHPTAHRNLILSDYDSLRCQVKKDSRNISYQWWFKPFESSPFMPLPNETFSYLSFAPVKSHHEGWYFCNVSNPFGHTISKTSFVKVLKYTLPVPAAKLTLTVIAKSRSGNKSVYYHDILAKVLASRIPNTNNNSQHVDERIRELHPTGCRIMTGHDNRFDRKEICDWTFSAVGENVTSDAVLNSGPSQQIKRLISATTKLKKIMGVLGNETNAGKITFSLDKTNYHVQKHSLGIIAMSLLCPKGQFLVENIYKCADCPPGSYGTLEKGVATCNICPRGSYQPLPGQTSCIQCPHGFITADKGARDHGQCKDENKFFLIFLLVNTHHGDVLVTTNVSGQLEIKHLKASKTFLMNKKWRTTKSVTVSAADATTNRTVNINGKSIVHMEPTIKELVLMSVLFIQGSAKVDPKTSRFQTPSRTTMPNPSPSTDVSNESTRIASPEKVAPTQPTPAQPRTKESLEDFKTTEQNGHGPRMVDSNITRAPTFATSPKSAFTNLSSPSMNVHPIKELSSEIPTEEVVSTQSIPTQTPPESAENKDSFNGTEVIGQDAHINTG